MNLLLALKSGLNHQTSRKPGVVTGSILSIMSRSTKCPDTYTISGKDWQTILMKEQGTVSEPLPSNNLDFVVKSLNKVEMHV